MISVTMTGRNDAHGYNYHRRVAISLNCIAEVLTDPNDEIIFVDCSTPDHMPTLPEAIEDTLTSKTKSLLRTLRIRSSQLTRFRPWYGGPTFDPISRNAAFRRSNPANKWIISTTSDMVFVPRNASQSLSDAISDLPAGFYGLPRFEIPDSLWERFDRKNPAAIIDMLGEWAQRLHLNEAVYNNEMVQFDNSGDFQLMLRDQIIAIRGQHEGMNQPWHQDSNLCVRMAVLNGKTNSLIDRCFAYHCTHSRASSFPWGFPNKENDPAMFLWETSDPCLPDQPEWGLAGEELEEIRLSDGQALRLAHILGGILPGLSEPYTLEPFVPESFNHGLLYDTEHTLPFVASFLTTLHPTSKIAYFGGGGNMLGYLGEFLKQWSFQGEILAAQDLLVREHESLPNVPGSLRVIDGEACIRQADLLLFDFGMTQFPSSETSLGIPVPQYTDAADVWMKRISSWFLAGVIDEQRRREAELPRLFLIIGARNTAVETLVSTYIGIGPSPHATHVTHGYLREDVGAVNKDSAAVDVWSSHPLAEALAFVTEGTGPDEPILGSAHFVWSMGSQRFHSCSKPVDERNNYRWAVIGGRDILSMDPRTLCYIWTTMRPVFSNDRYVCYSSDPCFDDADITLRGWGSHFVRLSWPLVKMCGRTPHSLYFGAITIFQKTLNALWRIRSVRGTMLARVKRFVRPS